jgi:RND family efflux transporter MFP subunit
MADKTTARQKPIGSKEVRLRQSWARRLPKRLQIISAVLLLVLTSSIWVVHWVQSTAKAPRMSEIGGSGLKIVVPAAITAKEEVALVAELKALNDAKIRSRVNGYVREWRYDIGATVQSGETLATVDAPDLEQQYLEAKGRVETAEAQAELAKLSSKRWATLRTSAVVSQQSADERRSDTEGKVAELTAVQANLARLQSLISFTDIVAPFTGVVTARKVDIGTLVGPSNPVEMFDFADIRQLRVDVHVPQSVAPSIVTGMRATLTLPQFRGQSFEATVETKSDAIEPNSRTMLVQLLVSNEGGRLSPGSIGTITFEVPRRKGSVRIPATALIMREGKPQVAVVGVNNKILFRSVEVEQDLGSELEIRRGLSASERLVDLPGSDIDGMQLPPDQRSTDRS